MVSPALHTPAPSWWARFPPEIPGSFNSATQWPWGRGAERCSGMLKLDGKREEPSHSEKKKIELLPALKMWFGVLHGSLGLGGAVL